jgi:Sap, sulfolipid-1-addressing protein
VSTEALVLALTAVVRPTSAAAIIAMLSTRRPHGLLACYILAGLVVSLTVGVLVVVLAQQLSPATARAGRPIVETVLGVASLLYASVVWLRLLPRRRADRVVADSVVADSVVADRGGSGSPSWMQRWLQDLSPSGAATAGVLTHLPGLVYLAALNAIAGSATGTLNGAVQVLIYNAIWFSLPIVALTLSIYRPTASREQFDRAALWARQHRRAIIVAFFGALGAYLLVTGGADLARLHE